MEINTFYVPNDPFYKRLFIEALNEWKEYVILIPIAEESLQSYLVG